MSSTNQLPKRRLLSVALMFALAQQAAIAQEAARADQDDDEAAQELDGVEVSGIRSALAWSDATAVLAREHNDANVLAVGGRMHPIEDMLRFVRIFLETPFSDAERHVRRIKMLSDYEQTGELPPLPESASGADA